MSKSDFKMINPKNGEEVQFGDVFHTIGLNTKTFGIEARDIEVNSENLEFLVKNQMIKVLPIENKKIKENILPKRATEKLTREVNRKIESNIFDAELLMAAYIKTLLGEKAVKNLSNENLDEVLVGIVKTCKKSVEEFFPGEVFNTLLRISAIELDKQYEDHIKNCKEIFVINPATKRVESMKSSKVKYWNNFSAFRSESDAIIALKSISDFMKKSDIEYK